MNKGGVPQKYWNTRKGLAGKGTLAVNKRVLLLKSKDWNVMYPKKEIDISDKCSKQRLKWDNDELQVFEFQTLKVVRKWLLLQNSPHELK